LGLAENIEFENLLVRNNRPHVFNNDKIEICKRLKHYLFMSLPELLSKNPRASQASQASRTPIATQALPASAFFSGGCLCKPVCPV
jgi:hypothetical protein